MSSASAIPPEFPASRHDWTIAPVSFGNHHVGDTLRQALTIANAGPTGNFTENLDASLGATTGAATATGTITGLAASVSNSTSLSIRKTASHFDIGTYDAACVRVRARG